MNPRIEKKVSKRLTEIAPKLFKGFWIDDEIERSAAHWRHNLGRELTARERKENTLIEKCRVNNICSVGGEYCSYMGDCNDYFTCFEWLKNNYCWIGNFPSFSHDSEFRGYPDTGNFKPTTRNLLKLAREHG